MKFFFLGLTLFTLFTGQALAQYGTCQADKNYHKTGRISGLEFDEMDTDKSGTLSFEEFKAVFPSTSQAGFGTLDTNKDSQLSEGEWDNFKQMHKGMGKHHGGDYREKT